MRSRNRLIGLAAFCVVSVLVAVGVVYVKFRPPERDASGSVVRAGRALVHDLRVGDCITDPFVFGAKNTAVHAVPCTHEHSSEVYLLTRIPQPVGVPYPGVGGVNDLARTACGVHDLPPATATYQRWFVRPEEKAWNKGDRRVVCLLAATSPQKLSFTR
ncbi:septum formation family protein [Nocardioides marmorisolisilvae]|uniref:septum formation family protein n=1 Tax=Nocardioides marmorisolisilvae TaxID=1542737 RepID=UPI00161CFC92|nr:septum formation family protein [Nocardioides marmorisolisilvae]